LPKSNVSHVAGTSLSAYNNRGWHGNAEHIRASSIRGLPQTLGDKKKKILRNRETWLSVCPSNASAN
jgi:hypothetical protein